MHLFMQWQVDQSGKRKLPPLPLPSSCMAALIGNNGICLRPPAQRGEWGIAPLRAVKVVGRGHCPQRLKAASVLTVHSLLYLLFFLVLKREKWKIILLCLDSELALHSPAPSACCRGFTEGTFNCVGFMVYDLFHTKERFTGFHMQKQTRILVSEGLPGPTNQNCLCPEGMEPMLGSNCAL